MFGRVGRRLCLMVLQSFGKINLALDVLGKRTDGYHDVRLIMQTVSLCDRVEVEIGSELSLKSNLPFIPTDNRNIAYRAAEEFFAYTKIKGEAKIYLDKKIPVGAGLGGGSSNGAAVICALNSLYKTNLSKSEMEKLAAKTGADTAFFITGGTCLAEGLGEVITPIPSKLSGYVLILKPRFSVSTKWVYENLALDSGILRPDIDKIIWQLKTGDIPSLAQNMANVLESVTEKRYPQIKAIKEIMMKNGALGAMMSGSGSAVFGIFDDEKAARNCAEKIDVPYDLSDVFTFV
jgi:4-diphosphocytidyl-2-C-methyl-D-erythritol kinase